MTDREKAAAEAGQGDEFALMDREDEQQILEELRGATTEKFIYKTPRGVELSFAGTKWAIRKMAERGEVIRIDGHPKIERCVLSPEEYVTVTVLGRRIKIDPETKAETFLECQVGAARGWIKQKLTDGRVVPDDFWFNKTISKACRNVQQALMPQDFKKEMISFLMKKEAGTLGPKGGEKKAGAAPQGQAAHAKSSAPAAPPSTGSAPAKAPAQKSAPPAPPTSPPAAAKAAAPAVPNTTKSAPGQAPRDAALDVLHQRFAVVLRQASGAGQDTAKASAFLKALTGKDSVVKLSAEEVKALGPVLAGVSKGSLRHEGGVIYDVVTGDQVYPAPDPQAEPPAEPQADPPPADDGAPPPEEPMF